MDPQIPFLQSEVANLEAEIERFTREKAAASARLNELKNQPGPDKAPSDHESDLNAESSAVSPEPGAPDVPAPIYHNHFDPEVARILNDAGQSSAKSTPEEAANILYENIFRFTGVTAFPINQALLSADEKVFGIRFDTFSNHEHKFMAPHYVILKKTPHEKDPSQHRWTVFRHTLPVYIPVEAAEAALEFSDENESSVGRFARQIYGHLARTQMKRDVFAAFGEDHRVQRLETDLACNQVRLFVGNGQELVVKSDAYAVTLAEVVGDSALSATCGALLTPHISGLAEGLDSAVTLLLRQT